MNLDSERGRRPNLKSCTQAHCIQKMPLTWEGLENVGLWFESVLVHSVLNINKLLRQCSVVLSRTCWEAGVLRGLPLQLSAGHPLR